VVIFKTAWSGANLLKNMKKYFLTGTDTGIGKTTVACHLLRQWNQQSLKTIGLKPIASGAEMHDGQLKNDDALKLQQAASVKLPYEQVNPIVFPDDVSPNIAAENVGESLTVARVQLAIENSLQVDADMALIEGVGGWCVPLNDEGTTEDLAIALGFPIVLVVGIRLGCLNHALLTVKAIQNAGLELVAWVANCIDPDMLDVERNIKTLKQRIDAPCWGVINFSG
tara:strand:- start:17245 stop:17919 length:675 start_codon:yes stop_codon:yes gene_type:complete